MLAYLSIALFVAAVILSVGGIVMLVLSAVAWRRERMQMRGSYDATLTNPDTGESISAEYKSGA